jgi:hypothetical protein
MGFANLVIAFALLDERVTASIPAAICTLVCDADGVR